MSNSYGLATSKRSSGFRPWWWLAFALFMALVGATAATQYIAYKTGYHRALGSFIQLADIRLYLPWSFLQWQRLISPTLFDNALRLAVLIFALPQIALLIHLVKKANLKGIEDLHGSARWAKLEEIQNMGILDGPGVSLGGFFVKGSFGQKATYFLRHNGPEHIFVFAPTRSGKGVCLVNPTLLAWMGSLFCLDIKGESWGITAWFRKNILGHKVFRLDIADESGKGARFNPLQEIRLNRLKAIPDVQNMATALIDPLGKGLDDYWTAAGFNFMASSLMHVCVKVLYEEKRYANLTDFIFALSNPDGNIDEFYDEMLKTDHAAWITELYPKMPESHGRDIHAFVASGAQEMKSKADSERSGVLNSVTSKLGLYKDPVVRMNMEASDFTIDDMMNHEVPVDVYLVTPPSDIQRFTPFNRLFISLLVSRRTEEMKFVDGKPVAGYKHRLLMLLDEFTAPGKIPVLEKGIAFLAGYGIRLMIFVQDIDQINEVYGKNNGILGNCHIRIAYAAVNYSTGELLSKMTGTTTVVHRKDSISGSGSKLNKSRNVQETSRPLLTPDECQRIPGIGKDSKGKTKPGDMLIFMAGQYPIYGKQILYFDEPEFMERVKGAPEYSDSLYFKRGPEAPATVAEAEKASVSEPIAPSKNFSDFLEIDVA
ncbi:MAG: type IV secretory system conjugative DNA transfer family protein [Deltaproteobacteria bacterium]|jgi:type IV secretion system protein VirD4|nr:type IV secretory system conjugative DNA transfer family protein [Deltaproteobacteria bacterium]